MVKRREAIPEESAHSQEANTAIPPPTKLHVTPWKLPTSKAMHRIHQDIYQGDQFNPGVKGNARFSPITDAKGAAIPTLYAAYTFDAALMESVFHDVSHAPGYKHYDKNKLNQQVHSTVKVSQNLVLADLSSVALRKLGVQRKQLIDTEKDQYPNTREWAQAIHRQYPDIQGLSWVSRQDDSARAVMLFGDRIPAGTLQQIGASRNLLQDDKAYAELLDLAERIGADVVPGK